MTSLVRALLILALVMLAYGVFMQARDPGPPGLRGVWMHMKRLGVRVRLVALIYVMVIVTSAVVRLMGWGA